MYPFSVSVSKSNEFFYLYNSNSIINNSIFSIASKLIIKFAVFLKIFDPQTVIGQFKA